jgi:hypothetical protein
MESIWSSVEFSSVCRDFDYKNYLLLHEASRVLGTPLSETAYEIACLCFEQQFLEDSINGSN